MNECRSKQTSVAMKAHDLRLVFVAWLKTLTWTFVVFVSVTFGSLKPVKDGCQREKQTLVSSFLTLFWGDDCCSANDKHFLSSTGDQPCISKSNHQNNPKSMLVMRGGQLRIKLTDTANWVLLINNESIRIKTNFIGQVRAHNQGIGLKLIHSSNCM